MELSPLRSASALRHSSPIAFSRPAQSSTEPALPSDEANLSGAMEVGTRPAPSRPGHVASLLGLGALSLFGGLVGTAMAVEAPSTVTQQPMPLGEKLDHQPLEQALLHPKVEEAMGRDSLFQQLYGESWNLAPGAKAPVGPRLIPVETAPKTAPHEDPIFQPLARPATQKGDYVRHHVNFSNLISDREFEDSQSARQEDIQRFLQRENSFLARYQEDGRSAAQIVTDAAHDHGVSPWVLLATLEKESGMVTRPNAAPRWLMRSAMGYGYDDGGSTAGKHSTFAYQMDKGAELLRQLYDQGRDMSFPATVKVDYGTHKIKVRNASTYALMAYTPHTVDTHLRQVGGGNYLFRVKLQQIWALRAEIQEAQSNPPKTVPA